MPEAEGWRTVAVLRFQQKMERGGKLQASGHYVKRLEARRFDLDRHDGSRVTGLNRYLG